jgi:hypothetical protein
MPQLSHLNLPTERLKLKLRYLNDISIGIFANKELSSAKKNISQPIWHHEE